MPTYEEAVKDKALLLLDKMLKDKKHGTAIKRAIHEIDPTTNFPELDVEETIVAPVRGEVEDVRKQVAGIGEKLDKFLKAAEDRDAENALASDLQGVQAKFHLTEDGLRKVMERMRDKNNPDAEAAAAFVVSQIPRGKPAAATGTDHLPQNFDLKRMFNGSDDADDRAKAITKDPWAYFDSEVRAVLGEAA